MITLWILLIPVAGAFAAWFAGGASPGLARTIAAGALALDAILLCTLWRAPDEGAWIARWSAEWIPALGIRFALGLDGLSLVLSIMACLAALAALVAIPSGRRDEGAHSALFLLTVAGVLGVFLATDLMLFFMFYEIMLLPAVSLILQWGSGDRLRVAMRFFVFTQVGGLLMFVAILGLHAAHFAETGVHSFEFEVLRTTTLSEPVAMLFLLGFALAFAVKLPLVPLHTWQPQTYAAAPAEGAILLAALMAKTAGYGLLRFAVPMFPAASERLAPWALVFGVFTVLYAAWLAYGQRDLRRLIAYSSAGHLGYVVLGAFAMNDLARSGAIIQMFCHGLSVAGLFLVADHIERRTGTRDLDELGGLWHAAPRLGGIGLVFVLATLGLPGLGNFIGEFLVLAGVFQADPVIGSVAAAGAVFSAAYSLRLMQRVFFGPRVSAIHVSELSARAMLVCGVLMVALIWIGLQPGALLEVIRTPEAAHSVASGVLP